MWQYNYSDDIYHYGVKGMKWGVRRDKEELDRLAGRAYKVEYNTDHSYTIKKGSKFHRVTANPKNEKTGYAYVSFVDEDVKGYRKEISTWLYEAEGVAKTFDMTMKATKDIKVASEKEKIDAFIDLCSNDKLDYMSIIVQKESSTNKEGKLIGKPAKLKKILTNAGIDDDLATYYALFSMNIYKNDTNKKLFIDALKSKGYDAIEDIEDSLSHRINPLIIFERENSLKVTKVTELPEVYSDTDAWKKIKEDAKLANASTKEYLKKQGIE